jgi:hypothetical protein
MSGDGKLYVKSACLVCRNKTYFCSYCDGVGFVFVEASDKSVSRWLAQLTEERKETIIKEAAEKQEAKE